MTAVSPARRRAAGFTLLEVMLAFVLLSMLFGLAIASMANGLRQVRRAGDATAATLYAQSLLADVGVFAPVMAGDRIGEFEGGRFRYRLRIRAIADPAPVAAGPANPDLERIAPRLFEVSLQVQWGDGGTGERLDFTQIKARSLVAADIQP